MDILAIKKAGKNAEKLLRPIYEDIYGLFYSFDGTLYRDPKMDVIWSYNQTPFQLYPVSEPKFESIQLKRRMGIVVSSADRVGPYINLANVFTGEWGVGLCARLEEVDDIGYFFQIWKDSDNRATCFYHNTYNRLHAELYVNGVQKFVRINDFYYQPKELLGIYVHVVPFEGIFFSLCQRGTVLTQHLLDETIMPLPSDTTQFSLGHRMRALTQRDRFLDGIYANVKFDVYPGSNPDANAYFERVGLV